MGNLSTEDLASKLRKALDHHQIQLEPAVVSRSSSPNSENWNSSSSNGTPSSTENSISNSSSPHLAYVTRILMSDDFDEDEQASGSPESLLLELASIIQPEDSKQRHSVSSDPPSLDRELDIHEALINCARAASQNNFPLFIQLARDLTSATSPHPSPDPIKRTAIMFLEALHAKISGTGSQAYRALLASTSAKMLLNMKLLNLPCSRVSHVFANETILRACRGAKKIHIVDFGISHGCQWPEVLQALSQRPEGPPELLRITGIDFHNEIYMPQTDKRLVEFAISLGIDLEYVGLESSSWETIQVMRRHDEFLVVNCNMRLRHLKDDSISMNQPRKAFFENIHRMRPDIFVQSVASVGTSSPFFMTRFEEALRHFSARMEYYDTWLDDDKEHKSFMERMQARAVMNVIGCEAHDQVERGDKHNVWGFRAKRAGLEPVPLDDEICQRTKMVWGGYRYNKNFGFGIDENWLLLGWKDTVVFGMSAWRVKKTTFLY